jgi:hypothetical protein
VKRRKLDKRLRKMEARIADLENARMWEPMNAVQIEGPELDPHELLAQMVVDWAHGWDDGEDWSKRGYL